MVDHIFPRALKANRVTGELSPDLVKYLLDLGAKPYEVPLGIHGRCPFTEFFASIDRGALSATAKGVWEVTQLLFSSEGPDEPRRPWKEIRDGLCVVTQLGFPSEGAIAERALVKGIIRRNFTRSQFQYLYKNPNSTTGQGPDKIPSALQTRTGDK